MSGKKHLQRIHKFITNMPSLSTTVTKVLEICNSPDASPNDLNRVISYDPVLSGQLLKLINSAYYGVACKVSSLTRAIIMLGMNTVKNMVLTTSILASLKGSQISKQINIDAFWAHSLCVGVVAKTLAKELQVPATEREAYFLAGLMHDLGKIPMMASFPELYFQAVQSSDTDGLTLYAAERLHFGLDHCQVGRLVGAKWQLSPEMLPAIGSHHQIIEPSTSQTTQWLYTALANQLANHLNIGSTGKGVVDSVLFGDLLDRLGWPVEALYHLEPTIAAEIQKAKIFLQIVEKG
jgi:HD-like signal output (HDOD) protein